MCICSSSKNSNCRLIRLNLLDGIYSIGWNYSIHICIFYRECSLWRTWCWFSYFGYECWLNPVSFNENISIGWRNLILVEIQSGFTRIIRSIIFGDFNDCEYIFIYSTACWFVWLIIWYSDTYSESCTGCWTWRSSIYLSDADIRICKIEVGYVDCRYIGFIRTNATCNNSTIWINFRNSDSEWESTNNKKNSVKCSISGTTVFDCVNLNISNVYQFIYIIMITEIVVCYKINLIEIFFWCEYERFISWYWITLNIQIGRTNPSGFKSIPYSFLIIIRIVCFCTNILLINDWWWR